MAPSFAFLLPVVLGTNGQSVLNPGGSAAAVISRLGWFVFILFLIVAVVMWALIALIATRPRGNLREHAPVNVGGGQNWILIGGFAIPTAILAVVFITGLSAMSKFPVHGGINMPAEILLTGHQWWWEIRYMEGQLDKRVLTANEIHIPVGRAVDIDLASVDVIHSFWIPTLHGKVDLIPGQLNRIRIQADHPGVFRGQCAEYCGAQHAHMVLLVVAHTPEDFQKWLAAQRAPAIEPATPEQSHGRDLFLSRACVVCHTIRGTGADGTVGPDLTHIALRRGIAANTLTNDEANLAAWVTHAQSIKPASAMPNLSQFNGQELRDLVAYLRNLR
jgi:cytochrome c oxidase subunit 2